MNGEKIKRIIHFAAGEWAERFSPGGIGLWSDEDDDHEDGSGKERR